MVYLLLTIFALVFIYLSWHKPIWAIGLIILALPAYQIRFELLYVPFTLLEVMIWLAFLVYFVKWTRNRKVHQGERRPYKTFPFQWLILLWLIVATLAVALSPNLRAALGLWKAYFIEPVMFFILFIAHIRTRKDLYKMFYFLGLSAFIVATIAIYQKFTGWMIPNDFWQAEETRRVTSVFGYPNAVGLYLGPIILLYFGWLQTEVKKIWPTIFKTIVIVLSLLAVWWAVSEGALFGLAVGFIVFMIIYNKRSRLAVVAILAVALIYLALNPAITSSLNDKLMLKDFSGQIRRHMWVDTISMLKDRPLTGAGLAGYQVTMEPYHRDIIWIDKTLQPVEQYLYPHNILLNFWSELGILGLVAFILILIRYFYLAGKNYQHSTPDTLRPINLSLICLMLALIVHGIVDAPYLKNDLAVMFWLFLGIITVMHLNKQKPDFSRPNTEHQKTH